MSKDKKPKKPVTGKPQSQKPVKPAQTDKLKPYVEVIRENTGGDTRETQN